MANITVAADYGSDFTNTTFNYFITAHSYGWSGSYYETGFQGRYDKFEGAGFEISKKFILIAGTVNSWSVDHPGVDRFWVSGLNVSAVKLMDAVLSESQADDKAMIAGWLAGADNFVGGKLTDIIKLYAGNDVADGGRGNDTLNAGSGNDTIIGGLGADDLFGEVGKDTFIYRSIKDSTVAYAGRDTIFDFSASDKIHLSVIDANTKVAGNQAFNFIGTAAFHGKAGELRYEKKASDTFIYGDVNGDKVADFAIHLDDAVTLSKGFFVL